MQKKNQPEKKDILLKTTIGALLFAAGLAAGYWLNPSQDGQISFHTDDCEKRYYLTSSTVGCDEFEDSNERIEKLNNSLNELVTLYKTQGRAGRISIWVRDLDTRQYAAVNEVEKYAPASLYKVPVMIAYYRAAEDNPTILQNSIVFDAPQGESFNNLEHYRPKDPLAPGTAYTVEELIYRMIVESDNDAMQLLAEHIEPAFFNKVLIDLGLVIPTGTDAAIDFVTAKSYANVYRILYNSSYLNRDFSQRALEHLSKTVFGGIKEALPSGVTVAHKFGERAVIDPSGVMAGRQLHDCGIVYKESRTYSLCIMTEGEDFEVLLQIIKDISAKAYTHL